MVVRIHQHAKFEANPSMRSSWNARQRQIWPNLQVKIAPKVEKSTDRNYNLISAEGGHDISACKIWRHSLNAFLGKCQETYPNGRTRRTEGRRGRKLSRMVGGTNGPMYRWKEGFRTDGHTDGRQTDYIMPPAPKGGGIKLHLTYRLPSFAIFSQWLFLITWIEYNPSISNYMPSKVWDEFTHPFPNSGGANLQICNR